MTFHSLHVPGDPLILPNAWDHASAALLAQHFPAVGTTSLGVAAAYGVPDAEGLAAEQTLDLARRIVHLPCFISVDIESGPASLAIELASLSIAGVNIEDAVGLPEQLCRTISEVKQAAPDLFINARTDTYWLGSDHSSTLQRLSAYLEAGADGVFVPGLTDPAVIADLVKQLGAPLNVLYSPDGLSVQQLAELGVARISTGSALYRASLEAALNLALSVSGKTAAQMLNYAQIQSLAQAGFVAE
ncbi:MAG TPA: isocitrate lyase/phosphoenolpyruvate mutase family protein [Micromonosporaceae bacterium]|nr:isocitrate lyase/phosphoenolpyruvate mutase family protein [Micromonosporaceae bacterium]HCU51016.1 isocitrate lyase/phosphoenolpyruvate mutase family protein [Micromonosporaceae bacterium]